MSKQFLRHANLLTRTVNYAGGRGEITVTYNAKDSDSPVEVMLCEQIGKDWNDEGFTLKDLRDALNGVPTNRALNFFTNSPGGLIPDGVSIRNWLSNTWKGEITNTIIGIAASAASWCIPANTVRAYKNSQVFMHRAMGVVFGNVDDCADAIEQLAKTDGQIADMYADQSGRSADEMLDLMKGKNGQGTLLTGQEAKDYGLVDEIVDGEPENQFPMEWLNQAREKLATLNKMISEPPQGSAKNTNQQQQDTQVNRQAKIALLNTWGCNIKDEPSVTDARIDELINMGKDGALIALNLKQAPAPAAPPAPAPANVVNLDDHPTIKALNAQVAAARRKEIQNAVDAAASSGRIAATEISNWVEDAVAATDHPTNGNPVLARLNKLPVSQPGVTPLVNSPSLEITGESFKDVQKFILSNGSGFRRQFLGGRAQNKLEDATLRDIGSRAVVVANTISKHKKMLVEMFNDNAIDADLQRQLILQDILEAYALNLLPLDAFSIKYENVPLQGSDEVVVPYFPLQATASTSFVKGTGYTTKSDWTQNSRKVTIGGDGVAASNGANATAGTAKNRLYQAIDFTSYDMRRQPYLNVLKLAQQAANKLGVDIASEIYSRVLVAGNFGAAVKTVAAAQFSPDDIADLAEYADTAEWPLIARCLVLTNTYKTPLLKDNAFKQYLSYGSTDPIRKAQIQEAYGFEDMYFVPNLAAKMAANHVGFINHKSAVLVAFAPIMPTPEVRNLLTAYDVAVEPRSGAVLEYRKFGNATTDTTTEVIESSFGAAKGVEAALKLIKTP